MDTPNKDLFRDTPIRYLGYANEVGEAFRQIIGTKMVNLSYGVATLYVLADTAHKGNEAFQKHADNIKQYSRTLFVISDAFIWQMLASVIIPGVTINRLCKLTNYLLDNRTKLSKNKRQFIVTTIGLTTIPFIIKPIDNFVDHIMNHSIRKLN